MACEWHRRAGGSPFSELPVPVLAGWQAFADAWRVQDGDMLRVRPCTDFNSQIAGQHEHL